MGLFEGLRKSRDALGKGLSKVLGGPRLDEETMEEAEELLLGSDLGWELTEMVMEELPRMAGGEEDYREKLASMLAERLPTRKAEETSARPEVVLVVGVNGSGKTTVIARLAARYQVRGERVLLACADTYRAAAAEQLQIWGDRLGAEVLTQQHGSDPGAVAFDAIKKSLAGDYDRLLVDTAGRIQTRDDLMAELSKIHRVCGKALQGAPHRTLLVLDGTVGQNAISQAQSFGEALPVTGIVVTKLDGTAKGGAVLAMASRLDIPVAYVGVGEGLDDLVEFEPSAYVRALLGLEELSA
ncbi:signal recognition particle-docking protein FtsY [Candidatus Fermentibacteria bacterium]|nr:signal recognition particle-docking protein FtsY [Candidatus Fermentibacteria bacterium]